MTGPLPAVVLLVALAAVPPVAAQSDSSAAPRAAAYTAAQAGRGEAVFRDTCAQCHVPSQFIGAFLKSWTGQSAYSLFTLIRTTMPFDSPGRLRRDEYADVVAYLLKMNAAPPGDREIPSDDAGLRQVRIPSPPDTTPP